MKHTYSVTGMSCGGCRKNVENALNTIEGIKASVVLNPPVATIEMEKHVSMEELQKVLSAAGAYALLPFEELKPDSTEKEIKKPVANKIENDTPGDYYCPMHCEGKKTYNKPGDCPVCGMDLLKVAVTKKQDQYTCPMHPEIIRNEHGACPICGMDLVPLKGDIEEEDISYKKLSRKFTIAVIFTLPIFLIAMSEMIPNNPLFSMMELKYWNWVELGLSIPVVFYATWMFFERAWRSVITWKLNMFTLIGIGAGVSWLFSVVALIFPNFFPDEFKTHHGTVYVYFEASTVILTLVLLGQLLEARAHGKTNTAIKELLKLSPSNATKITDGKESNVAIDTIIKGDLLRVKPGEKIPVDGSIKEGDAVIDESMITGEPIPIEKSIGDQVRSGTINGNRTFVMIAEKVGAETLLSQIIEMVNTASRSKAPIQKLADKISGYFVPVVVIISAITFILWAIYGPEPSYVYALVNAIAVLIIACPCALGLATPMSVMVGVGKGAQLGILIKNAEALEKMNAIDTLVIDKTGTLTVGKPSVEKIVSLANELDEKEILKRIVSINSSSEHPLAEATMRYGKDHEVLPEPVSNFESVTGMGVTAKMGNEQLGLGNSKLMEKIGLKISTDIEKQVITEQQKGKTVSYLSIGDKVAGFLVISDKIKPTSASAIKRLQDEGLKVIMFTGDNEDTAKAVSKSLGLDGFKAQMLPEDKLREIKNMQEAGKKVAMAGDGINDSPALSQADIGIAMGTGTDVAIQSASITLINGDLMGIANARALSAKVMSNIKSNLFFALGYNMIGIPIAAGILYPFIGILLSPMIAALAMSLSSVSVILNSLRLKSAKIK